MGSVCSCSLCDELEREEIIVPAPAPLPLAPAQLTLPPPRPSRQVVHELQDFVESRDTVGGHVRFLEPKKDIQITAIKKGTVHQVSGNVILKLAAYNEQGFFDAMDEKCPELLDFVPLYHGTATVRTGSGLQDYLVLEHVGCSNPSACDIKMGFVQRASHHDARKWASMREKAAKSTSLEYGFRPCGLSYFDWETEKKVRESKTAGRQVKGSELLLSLGKYFNQSPGQQWPLGGPWRTIVRSSISTIERMQGVMRRLKGIRFWGASLLFMLNTDAISTRDAMGIEMSFKMKLIDFSNAVFLGDGPDLEMISSLDNLKAMLQAMLDKAEPAANPAFTATRPDLSVQDAEQAWAMQNYAHTKKYGPTYEKPSPGHGKL